MVMAGFGVLVMRRSGVRLPKAAPFRQVSGEVADLHRSSWGRRGADYVLPFAEGGSPTPGWAASGSEQDVHGGLGPVLGRGLLGLVRIAAVDHKCGGAELDEVGVVESGDKDVEVGCEQRHEGIVRDVPGGNDKQSPR